MDDTDKMLTAWGSGFGGSVTVIKPDPSETGRDLKGNFYGMLTAMRPMRDSTGNTAWWCICMCGGGVVVTEEELRRGHVKSCGCILGKPSPRVTEDSQVEPGDIRRWHGKH